MKISLLLLFLTICFTSLTPAATQVSIDQLQGVWWSDAKEATADFAILDETVWLDYDSEYHPCKIEGDVLVFDLGEDLGLVKNRILSLEGDRLTLENITSKQVWVLERHHP